MECSKCSGLVIKEWMCDEIDEAYVWRCLNCGSLTDEIIQRNQQGIVAEKR
jgi:uncharacterized Zn finger protein